MPFVESAHTGSLFYAETRRSPSVPTVLLLHGVGGCHRDFDSLVATLAESYRVLALDWPGCGDSAAPRPASSASAALWLAVLEDFVRTMGIENAFVLGVGVGGYAATVLAARHKQAVRALVLANPTGFKAKSSFAFLSRAVSRVTKGTYAGARLLQTSAIRNDPAAVQRRREAASDPSKTAVTAGLWRSIIDPSHNAYQQANEITVPTLLIWGRNDAFSPIDPDGYTASKAIPGARLVSIDAAESPHLDWPVEFGRLVTEFILSVRQATSPLASRSQLLQRQDLKVVQGRLDFNAENGF